LEVSEKGKYMSEENSVEVSKKEKLRRRKEVQESVEEEKKWLEKFLVVS
jgi:hypothetical protein